MPLTKKGAKILKKMRETYGSKKKAESVFYASENKGTISGVEEAKKAGEAHMRRHKKAKHG